jgi:putative membrane protein
MFRASVHNKNDYVWRFATTTPIINTTMVAPRTNRRTGRLLFTGFSMGFADLIPGVSSGTIAFLYGIYQELLYSIRILTGAVPKLILRGKLIQAWKLVPFSFLIPLGIGMVLAVFGMVQIVSYLLDSQAVFVWSVFFGLVLGSAFVIRKRIKGWTARRAALLVAGFALTFFIVGLPQLETASAPLLTFGTGAIASVAMILPGISGSLIMVLLGQYEHIIAAISSLDVFTLGLFVLGIVTGLAAFVRLLSWLLHNHHSAVIATLTGVMLGSLGAIWPWQSASGAIIAPEMNWSFLLATLLMATGFVVVLLLERAGIAKEHVNDVDSKEFTRELKSQHE